MMRRLPRSEKWDRRFLDLARYIASEWSKDPSTKTGAVIIGPDRRSLVSVGYNGFAPRVKDSPKRYANRSLKYRMIIHCEINAITVAHKDLDECTLYTWPFMPCAACAGPVIRAGITRVVAPVMGKHSSKKREDANHSWKEDCDIAKMMFREAGIELVLWDFPTGVKQ